MSLHIPASFAVPGIAIPACAAILVIGVWSLTLERINYERAEEIAAAQQANASIALAYEERTARLFAAGRFSADAFAAFGDELQLGAATAVELIGLDGKVLARRAADEPAPGRDLRESTLLQAALAAPRGSLVSVQGIPQYISYRVLAGQPMLVAVATSVQHTLRAFHARETEYQRTAWIATALILLLAAALFVAWLFERSRDEQFR
ncbi:MAG TPA: hypothetical protein VIV54_21470, partial [Burkholderiales bacterium]